MRDVPIIFSAPMILALLREAAEPGTGKSMTRRLAWSKPLEHHDPSVAGTVHATPWQSVKPGDRLWVKEAVEFSSDHFSFWYAADKTVLREDLIQRLRRRGEGRVQREQARRHRR